MRLLTPIAASYRGAPAAALIDSALHETQRLWKANNVRGALSAARVAVQVAPQMPMLRYNAGAAGWWMERQTPQLHDGLWRSDLSAFLASAPAKMTPGWQRRSGRLERCWTKPRWTDPSFCSRIPSRRRRANRLLKDAA
jgi:hypothetical protein